MDCLRRRLQDVQMSVLKAHDCSPTPAGLRRLQYAVQRRICQGDDELTSLANRAFVLMGLPCVRGSARDMRAEEVFAHINGQHAQHRIDDLLAQLGSEGIDVEQAVADLGSLCRRRRPLSSVTTGLLHTWVAWEKLGLAEQFYRRADTPAAVARLKNPSPDVLLGYVMRNQPVVISGAFDEESFPLLRSFRDFDYLRARSGHNYVKMKHNFCQDDHGHQIFINDPVIEVPFAEYLDMIRSSERSGRCQPFYMGKAKMAEEVPELLEDLSNSDTSPGHKYRDCFGANSAGAYMYLGCNHNSTSIHSDPFENITTVISGTKTYDLYPPYDADCLSPTPKRCLNSAVPPFLQPDALPASVQNDYPLLRNARPLRVELLPGEVLYLPIFWWHCVTGSAECNMTLNWWCDMHPDKISVTPETQGARSIVSFIQSLVN